MLAGLAVIILALVFNLRWNWQGDDAIYREFASIDGQFGGSLTEFLRLRLSNWTSRVAIEAAIFLVIEHLILWRVITAIALWLVVVLPPFLITDDAERRPLLLLVMGLFALSVPSVVWFGAGFIATSANYLWPLGFGLLAALPAVLLMQRRSFSPLWYLGAVPAALFVGSAEIVAVLLAGLYLFSLGLEVYRLRSAGNVLPRNRVAWVILGLLSAFLVGMVVFHLLSPGNASRRLDNWNFDPWPVILERSYSSTLRQVFMSGYVIPLVFFTVIMLIVFSSGLARRLPLVGLLAGFPIVGSLLLRDAYVAGTLGTAFADQFNFGNLLWDPRDPALPSSLDLPSLFVFTTLTLLLATSLISVIYAFWGDRRLVVILILLVAGLATKFITVNSIGGGLIDRYHRTDLFMLVAFALATLVALTKCRSVRAGLASLSRSVRTVPVNKAGTDEV